MSVQYKKNFTKLDNQDHILVKKGLAAVARRFLETRKVRQRDVKVFFLYIRILFFSKNATHFVIDPAVKLFCVFSKKCDVFLITIVVKYKIKYNKGCTIFRERVRGME